MRLVVALGGNALLRRGESMDEPAQRHNVDLAVKALAPLASQHQLVVTHGNGPQVGLLALQAEAYAGAHAYPLDVLGAESEGMIGYLIEKGLRNALKGREVATLLTQVIVDPGDPAFSHPTKPIGPVYGEAEAKALATQRGWAVGPDGPHWRRLVPSPEPRSILELTAIRILSDLGVTVICTGGGGIPVALNERGAMYGVEAVIDKDLAAALLATQLPADGLLLLTDVDAVYADWGQPAARPIARATPHELRRLELAPGSMAPKVEAACRFVEAGGQFAAIGALTDVEDLLHGGRGTRVVSLPVAASRESRP